MRHQALHVGPVGEVTRAVKGYGWNAPFFVTGALCLIAAVLYLKIDATKRITA